jgi:sugar lactone lactonase YvrE
MWDPRTGRLLWVDQYAGLVHAGDLAGDGTLRVARTYDVGHPVGAVVPAAPPDDGWLVAYAAGFGYLSVAGTVTELAQPERDAPVRTRMNDGKCDARGRFYAGSMAWDKTPGMGSLYRLDPDLSVTTVLTGVTISNGLAWSADGRTLHYVDTPAPRVDAYAVDDKGNLTDRRTAIDLADAPGHADGMCVDDEGCLWVAMWGGAQVRRHAPDGTLLGVVEVDAPQVSSCCFGGPDRRTLFITTSQEGMDAATRAANPGSGYVFSVELPVSGPVTSSFRTVGRSAG